MCRPLPRAGRSRPGHTGEDPGYRGASRVHNEEYARRPGRRRAATRRSARRLRRNGCSSARDGNGHRGSASAGTTWPDRGRFPAGRPGSKAGDRAPASSRPGAGPKTHQRSFGRTSDDGRGDRVREPRVREPPRPSPQKPSGPRRGPRAETGVAPRPRGATPGTRRGHNRGTNVLPNVLPNGDHSS